MNTLTLRYDEFRLITRLCRPVDIGRLPAGFDFRGYLLGLLRPKAPAVARKVEGMGGGETTTLRAEVAEFQGLAG